MQPAQQDQVDLQEERDPLGLLVQQEQQVLPVVQAHPDQPVQQEVQEK